MTRMVPGEVSGQNREAVGGGPVCRQADVKVLGTGEFAGRIIQVADAELQRQIPLEVRLERAGEYISKACEEDDLSLRQL